MDGRTWFKGQPEFVPIIKWVTLSASELDLLELGPRPSVAYCKQLADSIYEETPRHARMLHPVEWKRADGN